MGKVDSTHLSLARFLWFASFKIGSTVRVLGKTVLTVRNGDMGVRLYALVFGVFPMYGSRHSRWARRCASSGKLRQVWRFDERDGDQ